MKRILAVTAVLALVLAPAGAMASDNGHGGNGGNHGGNGGNGGNGGDGGHGGGMSGGGSTPSTPSVSAPSSAGTPSTAGVSAGVSNDGWSDNQAQTLADFRACDQGGLVSLGQVRQDGSFTYGTIEYVEPYFVSCMRNLGHTMRAFGREELTNFGTR
jgi:hypothetical protein